MASEAFPATAVASINIVSIWQDGGAAFFLAFVLGGLVGLSELMGRYSWGLLAICRRPGGLLYVIVNGTVSMLVYRFALEWDLSLGLQGKSEFWRVLLVSLATMAIFRSSFANLRVGTKEFPTGFTILVEFFLAKSERSLDRSLMEERFDLVSGKLTDLTYDDIKGEILFTSTLLLRSITEEDVDRLTRLVKQLDDAVLFERQRKALLAMRIVDVVGEQLFETLLRRAREGKTPNADTVTKPKSSDIIEKLDVLKAQISGVRRTEDKHERKP